MQITVPDLTDSTEAAQFLADLEQHMDVRGVTKLRSLVSKMLKNTTIARRQHTAALKTVDYINGIRTRDEGASKTRSLRNSAKQFFDSLDNAALRHQCKFYNVKYEDYDSVEAIVETLVTHYMEKVAQD